MCARRLDSRFDVRGFNRNYSRVRECKRKRIENEHIQCVLNIQKSYMTLISKCKTKMPTREIEQCERKKTASTELKELSSMFLFAYRQRLKESHKKGSKKNNTKQSNEKSTHIEPSIRGEYNPATNIDGYITHFSRAQHIKRNSQVAMSACFLYSSYWYTAKQLKSHRM